MSQMSKENQNCCMFNLGICIISLWTKNEARNIVFLLLNLVQDILKKSRAKF